MNRRGFTLLEVLVASAIMALAITGLLSSLSASMRNAGRLTDYDRATLLARAKMDELLAQSRLPQMTEIGGAWDPSVAAGLEAAWRARVTVHEMPPGTPAGAPVLERIELEVSWRSGQERKRFVLESFRRGLLLAPQ